MRDEEVKPYTIDCYKYDNKDIRKLIFQILEQGERQKFLQDGIMQVNKERKIPKYYIFLVILCSYKNMVNAR